MAGGVYDYDIGCPVTGLSATESVLTASLIAPSPASMRNICSWKILSPLCMNAWYLSEHRRTQFSSLCSSSRVRKEPTQSLKQVSITCCIITIVCFCSIFSSFRSRVDTEPNRFIFEYVGVEVEDEDDEGMKYRM
jgi:hypothetical protein